MKFYLASRFSRKDEVEANARALRLSGYEVISRWHTPGHQLGPSQSDAERTQRGVEDFEDVLTADAVIVHTGDVDPVTGAATRGGYHTEVGIALGTGKPIALVGERLNVFHYIPGIVQFETFDEAWHAIDMGWWPPTYAEARIVGSPIRRVRRLNYPVAA